MLSALIETRTNEDTVINKTRRVFPQQINKTTRTDYVREKESKLY